MTDKFVSGEAQGHIGQDQGLVLDKTKIYEALWMAHIRNQRLLMHKLSTSNISTIDQQYPVMN